jgi:hypothetical protein
VIVSFLTRELRDTCESLEQAERAYGVSGAQALLGLLADIEATETVDQLISFYAGGAAIEQEDSLLIIFAPECQARFEAVQTRGILDECGRLDWSKVRRLKLTEVTAKPDA